MSIDRRVATDTATVWTSSGPRRRTAVRRIWPDLASSLETMSTPPTKPPLSSALGLIIALPALGAATFAGAGVLLRRFKSRGEAKMELSGGASMDLSDEDRTKMGDPQSYQS